MSKSDKLLDAMWVNPQCDWTINDIQRLCRQVGWQCLAPSNGSHWKIVVEGNNATFTVPARRPIKPVYIRKLVAMIDEANDD